MLVNDIVYGLGQSNSLTFRHNFSIPRTWNLFSQYPNPHLKENQTENATTLWGSHPFYLGIDDPERGDAYGVLLLNSFPITVTSNARPSLTFKTFGGHLEFVSINPQAKLQHRQNSPCQQKTRRKRSLLCTVALFAVRSDSGSFVWL